MGVLLGGVVVWWSWLSPAAKAAEGPGRRPVSGIYLQDDEEGRSARLPWVQGSQVRFRWQELEPEEGRYDFSQVDGWLAMLERNGKKGVMGVMLRCEDGADGLDACTPPWALGYDPIMAGGKPRLNYLHPQVQERLRGFIAALAERYAGDKRLSHVEIDLGYAGEASPCSLNLDAADGLEECAAYQARYGNLPSGWERYLDFLIRTYGERFRLAGGPDHVPLQAVITGKFFDEAERATVVQAALAFGIGLHDKALAPAFLQGGSQESRCAQDWQPGDTGYSDRFAYKSHWVPLERHGREVAVSFEFAEEEVGDGLKMEERLWWSILNALDKHASVLYASEADLALEELWRYFLRYAGRDERTTPDAWIALRGSRRGACADTGDYEWFLRRRADAAGGSSAAYAPNQADAHLGKTWQGAFSRSTNVAERRPSLYFDVDDDYLYGGEHVVAVEVTYWDGTPEMAGLTWELAYDAVGSPRQVAGLVTLRGSNRWLVHPFVLADATFRNRLPDAAGKAGSDLRLSATGGGDVWFHMVRVRPLTTISRPAVRPSPTATPTATRGLMFIALTRTRPSLTLSATPQPSATALPPTPTPTVVIRATPTPMPTTPATSTPLARGAEIVRYRVNGADGLTHDAFLSADQPRRNFGDANVLVLRGDGGTAVLLFFDLSAVPVTAQVEAAWLELTIVGRNLPQELRGTLYSVPRPWSEDEVTWESWRDDGLQPMATFALRALGPVEVPIGPLVQEWLAHPEQNHGLLLRAEGVPAVEYYLASGDWQGVRQRPRLRVRLAGEVTPTPFMMPEVESVRHRAVSQR